MTYAIRNKWPFLVRLVVSLMVCLYAASSASTFADETPIAMLTDVSGDIELLHDAKADSLRLLAELKSRAVVRLKKGARAVVLYLKNGDQYALSGPGTFTLAPDGPLGEKQSGASVRLGPVIGKNGKPMQFKNENLSQAGMVMRGLGKRPIPAKRPVAAVVLAAPSVFEWESIGQDVKYDFELKDEKGSTLFSRVLPDTKLSLPEGITLDADTTYRWSVSARDVNGIRYSSIYTFRLANNDTKAEFDNFYPQDTATVAERAAFAAWLESKGLAEEAKQYRTALNKRYGLAEPPK